MGAITDIKADNTQITFDSIEDFLADAVGLEDEAAERYEEMADAMAVHHNIDVAELFQTLGEAGRKHAQAMRKRADGKELPHLAPWEFKWCGEAPETPPHEDIHYLMTTHHALKIACCMEKTALAFYQGVADGNSADTVRDMARDCAQEEAEHLALLEKWIVDHPEPAHDWDDDPDPPVMPE